MPTQRFLANSAGAIVEVVPNTTSSGSGDAGKIPALNPAGKIDETMIPTSYGPDAQTLTASETMVVGALGNIYDAGGNTFRVRNADASNNRPAHCFTKTGIANGAAGTVYFDSSNDVLSGLTPGERYLSTSVPGATQATAPTTPGHIVQKVGFAHSATALNFCFNPPILLA